MGTAAGQIFAAHGLVPVGLALLAFSLFAALAAIRLLHADTASPASARAARIDMAVEIVRGRFARGEIDADEYNRLVTGLTRTA